MIKALCPCGGTYEIDTEYHQADYDMVVTWLMLHQECVNIRVIEHQVSAKKASIMQYRNAEFDWRSGFTFLDNGVDFDSFEYRPVGNVTCKECDYVQAKGAPPLHSSNCSHYEERPK